MTMNETLGLTLAATAGLLLGAIFFGGLWWTVRKGLLSTAPAAWFLGSLLVRTSLVLAGFYLVGHGDWRRLAACLCGFIVARFSVSLLARSPIGRDDAKAKEASHAP
jgi:F1F0 ATPase subunit 2